MTAAACWRSATIRPGEDAASLRRLFEERWASERDLNLSGVWRYRELVLPSVGDQAVTHPEGNTPLLRARRIADWAGLPEPSAEARRPQPDRFVQGPGHDGGRHPGQAHRCHGRRLRLDRQHLGGPGGLRRPGRAAGAGLRAGGPGRSRQAVPVARLWRHAPCWCGAISTPASGWCRRPPRSSGSTCSTRSTRSGSRGRRPSSSSCCTSSAGRCPTGSCCRPATSETRPPSGRP